MSTKSHQHACTIIIAMGIIAYGTQSQRRQSTRKKKKKIKRKKKKCKTTQKKNYFVFLVNVQVWFANQSNIKKFFNFNVNFNINF